MEAHRNFYSDAHHHHHHHHHPPNHYHHERPFNNHDIHHHITNESFSAAGFWSNGDAGFPPPPPPPHSMPLSGRKRGFNHPGGGPSPDFVDSGSHTKLYVAHVPRTASEEDIRPVFEEHGKIIEVVLFRDKKTGQQQGSCFVKYAALEEADRAIRALHNRHTFPGEVTPIIVKFAERERERFGTPAFVEKLYVGGLNKETSRKEIEEIFSPYGFVEDIYIVRDELRQSRGCAFVKFPRRDMAVAAIQSLNGTCTMRGCDQPLIVRFADPKKPRMGELRAASSLGDSTGGRIQSNGLYPGQHISTGSHFEAVSQMANQEPAAFGAIQEGIPSQKLSPTQLPHMSLQQTQTQQTNSQLAQEVVSEMQKQLHSIQSSCENLEQQKISQITRQESGSNSQVVTNAPVAGPASSHPGNSLESDWSEHTCPDGHKYYYNCVSFESRWEKPKEFSLFEQQLQNPCKQFQFLPSVPFDQQVTQRQKESDVMQIQSESSKVIGTTCG